MTLFKALSEFSDGWQLLENEPMHKHTTLRVGGPARLMYLPKTDEQLARAVRACRDSGERLTVIGNGSNLLVRDCGIDGLTVRLGENFSGVWREDDRLRARAGEMYSKVAKTARESALAGLEFASGIPASVGGAAVMNAGAYGGQTSDVVESLRVLRVSSGEIADLTVRDMAYGYRTSAPLASGDIVLSAVFRLTPGDERDIQAKMDDLNARRREKQPLNMPSAGSAFKRPEGHFAGALIEQAGLKGARVGGAQVSEKHAGFIVNAGGATADDVIKLIETVQKRVFESSGVMLEREVRII